MTTRQLWSRSAYKALSLAESLDVKVSEIGSASPRTSFVLRKHIKSNNFLRLENRSPVPEEFGVAIGLAICRLKAGNSSKSGTRRNLISEPRSSKEFWIGVPVKHHRM